MKPSIIIVQGENKNLKSFFSQEKRVIKLDPGFSNIELLFFPPFLINDKLRPVFWIFS